MKTIHVELGDSTQPLKALCGEELHPGELAYIAKRIAFLPTETVIKLYKRIPCQACLESDEFQMVLLANV